MRHHNENECQYPVNETPIYTIRDLGKKLKISAKTLREYVKRGDLRAKKIGRSYFVTEPNLMNWLDPSLF